MTAEIKGLCKKYPSFELKDVSFGLEKGRIAVFIGRNGAGKTTTIKAMLNLIHSDGGSAEFRAMIALVYRYEALGAVPLGLNAAVLALLYGLGETRLTLLLNFARVFIFRIPVFWFLQRFTALGEKSVGLVMLISNTAVAVLALIVGLIVIRRFKRRYSL